ncbi:hypothetical protein [Streptomyces sp. NPDC058307]|uniref:hypothetical protein n=1 Tax=Streptomyces sp. NPDC058307 TaxID=3346439 RepID=UPI0036E2AC90
MTDATSRPGADGTRGEGKIGRGTADDPAGSHSPLVTPTESEAPDLDPVAGRPAGNTGSGDQSRDRSRDQGGFGRDSADDRAGRADRADRTDRTDRDKASGLGHETERARERERERGAGSDAVGGVGPGVGGVSGHEARLLPHDESDKLSTRLQHAVAGFVDEPRSAVEEADQVLEEVATRFAEAVKQRRRTLRNSWQAGDGGRDKGVGAGDTEQLRLALRDYRELTERLLHS